MLPDLLVLGLKLVVCGTAAGSTSARVGAYYAGPGNKFWRTLCEVGLTPRQLSPPEYRNLLEYGVGLTDLVKSKSGMDSGLTGTDFGSNEIMEKMIRFQPKILCFNGKRAAEEFFGQNTSYGLQSERINSTKIYVAPSTSSAGNAYWDVRHWQEVSSLCRGM